MYVVIKKNCSYEKNIVSFYLLAPLKAEQFFNVAE
jgi:hypothetical protein